MSVRILIGDARERLRELPDESVHCVVTSPPYYGLRDYGVAGQIGLEASPDEYITMLVEVFREVRRVMRKDATLWLNIGDSYARMQPDNVPQSKNPHCQPPSMVDRVKNGGLKAKDLLMIPARVALALQQPYYSGRIKRVEDRIWLAAMVDGEGCMFIHKRKAGSDSGARWTKADGTEMAYTRTHDTFSVGMEISNTNAAIVQRCIDITGQGSICSQSPDQNGRRKQTIYRWNMRTNECREIIREIYPFLVAKQQQARIMLGCPPSGDHASACHQALIGLHRGKSTDIDFAPPKPMTEPGFWLRSDIIWSKLNPMPESVTDRPTSAHEHVLLLAKAERYFYDAEAVKEPAITGDPRRPYGSQGSWELDGRPTEQHPNGKRRKIKVPGGWDTGDGAHGTIHRSGRTSAEYVEADEITHRNIRNVWTIATQPYSDAHFATFPPDLIEPCIKAGCPPLGTVLDPFFGAGTTGLVADRLGRNCIGIELNPQYATMAERRIAGDAGMFAEVMSA